MINRKEYTAVFVPLSRSRNAKSGYASLNWKITLKKKKHGSLETDYMQGIGHAPGYNDKAMENGEEVMKGSRGWKQKYFETVAEKGRYFESFRRLGEYRDWYWAAEQLDKGFGVGISAMKPVPPPKLRDVMCSLLLDSSVLECGTFEQWCGETGSDVDSRKAEEIYKACLDIGLRLRYLLGDEKMNELRKLYQDY